MISPLDVFREFRETGLREPKRLPVTGFEILLGGAVIAGLFALVARYADRIRPWFRWMSRGGRFGMMLIGIPLLFIGALVGALYLRFRERGTQPFPFPVIVPLPRWRIYRRDLDAALYLTDGRGILCLFARGADDKLEDILDSIDPQNTLEIDDESRDTITFELDANTRGMLRRLQDPTAYAFLIGHPHLVDDVGGVLLGSRVRQIGQKPQKWRPLLTEVARAQLRR